MVSFVGKLSVVVVVLLEGKMAAAFKFTMIAAVVVALGRDMLLGDDDRWQLLLCVRPKKGNLASELPIHFLHGIC